MKKTSAIARRSAAVAAIIMGVVFAVSLVSPQVRAAVRDFFIEVYEKFTRFSHTGDNDAASVDQGYPDWLPENYFLKSESRSGEITRLVYADDSGSEIKLVSSQSSNAAIGSDNEHREYSVVEHNGVEYHFSDTTDERSANQVVWVIDDYRYVLESDLDVQALLRIAQDIRY